MTDNVVALSRFRADLSRALSRRGKKLLEAAHFQTEVQSLDPLEAYFVIKELGVDDATPILLAATPEQVQACVDLDCWDNDAVSILDLDAWLAPFAAEGPEALAHMFLTLDHELQVIFLAKSCAIYDTRSEEAPEGSAHTPRMTTPDSYFAIEPRDLSERELDPFVLIDAIYRTNIDEAFKLLTAAKWELMSTLEENAFQFRSGRLQDMGFLEPARCAMIFNPPKETTSQPSLSPHVKTTLPALYASAYGQPSLLMAGLGRVTDPLILDRVESDLVFLTNAAVIAFNESPRDLKHVFEIAERVRNTITLGLEHKLSPKGPLAFPNGEQAADDAARVLTQHSVRTLFATGYAVVEELAQSARRATQDPVAQAFLSKNTENDDYSQERADRCFLQSLAGHRPLWAGFDRLHPEQKKAFSTKKEIEEATQRLDELLKRIF